MYFSGGGTVPQAPLEPLEPLEPPSEPVPVLPPAQAATVPFPPWLVFLAEMFHPRVLRHFIPVLVGWWLAVQAAISLMQVLYDCPDRKTAAEFLRRQRRSRPSGMEEPYTVLPQSLDEDRERSVLLST